MIQHLLIFKSGLTPTCTILNNYHLDVRGLLPVICDWWTSKGFWYDYKRVYYQYRVLEMQGMPSLCRSLFANELWNEWLICAKRSTTCCSMLQYAAARCNTLQHAAICCIMLQHAATRRNTPQHAATRCNTLQHAATCCTTLYHDATCCNTKQHDATRCNTLQRAATSCNTPQTLQRTATHTATRKKIP